MAARDAGAQPSGRLGTARAFAREIRAVRTQKWGNLWGYVFIAPALILYLFFNVWPIIRGFLMAFTDYRFLFPDSRWAWNGVDNFVEMTGDQLFWHSLGVSVKYSLMVLPPTVIIALAVAVLISRVQRGAQVYRWLVYFPAILPIAVTMLMWRELYNNQFGFINNFLRSNGIANPPDWFGNPNWVLPALAFIDIWRGFGFPTLLFLVGLYAISNELYEAAAIDGAGAWQQLWSVTLPLLKPVVTLVIILNAHIVSATEQILLTTLGGPQNASHTLGYYLYNQAFTQGDLRLGYAAAMSLIAGLISAAITLVTFKLLRSDNT